MGYTHNISGMGQRAATLQNGFMSVNRFHGFDLRGPEMASWTFGSSCAWCTWWPVCCEERGWIPQGLEPQLQQALMQLEPLELLASEREASRSRPASRLKGGLGGIVFWGQIFFLSDF